MVPDEETRERIRQLAIVGLALDETSNETTHQTNFFLANEALTKFADRLAKLDLDVESKDGMDRLVRYLRIKIARRLKASGDTDSTE